MPAHSFLLYDASHIPQGRSDWQLSDVGSAVPHGVALYGMRQMSCYCSQRPPQASTGLLSIVTMAFICYVMGVAAVETKSEGHQILSSEKRQRPSLDTEAGKQCKLSDIKG